MILTLYKKEIIVSENGTKEIINVSQLHPPKGWSFPTINLYENYIVKTSYDSNSFLLEIKNNEVCILQAVGNNICLIDKR